MNDNTGDDIGDMQGGAEPLGGDYGVDPNTTVDPNNPDPNNPGMFAGKGKQLTQGIQSALAPMMQGATYHPASVNISSGLLYNSPPQINIPFMQQIQSYSRQGNS